jgi:hypothetical protein
MKGNPIHIFMLNVANMAFHTTALLNDLISQGIDVIMLQEPRAVSTGVVADGLSKDGLPILAFSNNNAWYAFHHPILSPDHPPCAITYVRKDIPGLTASFRPDLIDHPDVVPVLLTLHHMMVPSRPSCMPILIGTSCPSYLEGIST